MKNYLQFISSSYQGLSLLEIQVILLILGIFFYSGNLHLGSLKNHQLDKINLLKIKKMVGEGIVLSRTKQKNYYLINNNENLILKGRSENLKIINIKNTTFHSGSVNKITFFKESACSPATIKVNSKCELKLSLRCRIRTLC